MDVIQRGSIFLSANPLECDAKYFSRHTPQEHRRTHHHHPVLWCQKQSLQNRPKPNYQFMGRTFLIFSLLEKGKFTILKSRRVAEHWDKTHRHPLIHPVNYNPVFFHRYILRYILKKIDYGLSSRTVLLMETKCLIGNRILRMDIDKTYRFHYVSCQYMTVKSADVLLTTLRWFAYPLQKPRNDAKVRSFYRYPAYEELPQGSFKTRDLDNITGILERFDRSIVNILLQVQVLSHHRNHQYRNWRWIDVDGICICIVNTIDCYKW